MSTTAKPKLGQRVIRSTFVSMPIASLLFLIFYLSVTFVNTVGASVIMAPTMGGLLGFIIGISAGLGIELSKDLET